MVNGVIIQLVTYCRASHTGDACRGRGRERERGISSELADMTCCELHLRCRHRHCRRRRCRCCRRWCCCFWSSFSFSFLFVLSLSLSLSLLSSLSSLSSLSKGYLCSYMPSFVRGLETCFNNCPTYPFFKY